MANNGKHEHLSTDDPHHLRHYLVRATKASLCVSGWFVIAAGLLTYGPPAVSVSADADGVVGVSFGIMLSAGIATVLTIVLAVSVLALIGWTRDRSGDDHPETATHDAMEDDSHA